MTRQEKTVTKRLARNLGIYSNVTSILGGIIMIIGILMVLTATEGNTTGNEVLVFAIGAATIVTGMILSARTYTKYVTKLNEYRIDLLLKKDKYYYFKACSYAKKDDIENAVFYHDLIKNTVLKDISLGFIFGKVYDKLSTEEYNDFVQKFIDDLN